MLLFSLLSLKAFLLLISNQLLLEKDKYNCKYFVLHSKKKGLTIKKNLKLRIFRLSINYNCC